MLIHTQPTTSHVVPLLHTINWASFQPSQQHTSFHQRLLAQCDFHCLITLILCAMQFCTVPSSHSTVSYLLQMMFPLCPLVAFRLLSMQSPTENCCYGTGKSTFGTICTKNDLFLTCAKVSEHIATTKGPQF